MFIDIYCLTIFSKVENWRKKKCSLHRLLLFKGILAAMVSIDAKEATKNFLFGIIVREDSDAFLKF